MNRSHLLLLFVSVLATVPSTAQFIDHFDGDSLRMDPRAATGWTFFTGDGSAVMDFQLVGHGRASVCVDATRDARNIWWALIKRRVSDHMDLHLLRDHAYALRVEARIKASHAPRRVNLHLNTQRTTNFHSHLMEFDIADTTQWHTISMTTHGFDAVPGDSVYGQLALMDWGLGTYRVDLEYFRVDIVKVDSAGPDKGDQIPYHPPLPDPKSFALHVSVDQDCTLDREFPDMRFNDWACTDESGTTNLLAVGGTQFVIFRWDLLPFSGKVAASAGLLELTTYALQRLPGDTKDFGMVRIVEIIGGERGWRQQDISYGKFCGGAPINLVLNGQMIVDVHVAPERGGKTFATIPRPVMQRLIDGTTRGLAVLPLGAVHASFYAMEDHGGIRSAALHFGLSSKY